MKKKYLSGLVILITAILVTYMIVNNRKEESGYTMVQKETESISTVESKDIDSLIEKVENEEKDIVEKEKNEIGKEEKNIESDEKENVEEKKESINEEKLDVDINDKDSTIENFEMEEEISVFKIDKNLIAGSLSFSEKKSLAKIITSLSMNDYALIMESVKNDGELECVIEVNQILRERLDEKEYNLIKEILEPYINLEVL